MDDIRLVPNGGDSSFCGLGFVGSLNSLTDLFDLLTFPARSLEAKDRMNILAEEEIASDAKEREGAA
jgi:hypothetical protein